MSTPISRTQAKKWTLGAQGASLVFVLGAGALGVIGLPEPTLETPISPAGINHPSPTSAPTSSQDNNEPTRRGLDVDTLGLAQRLGLLDNAPAVTVETPVINTGPKAPETPVLTDSAEIAKRVRYIGFISDPDNRHAFIRIDGKQRIVSKGQEAKAGADGFSDLMVERITPTYIVLSDGEGRAKVDLANRTGQSITMIGGGNVNVAAPANNGSLLTAEDEARIQAMPPRQQPRARIRLERERRGLSPDPERRPPPEPRKSVTTSFNKKKDKNQNN